MGNLIDDIAEIKDSMVKFGKKKKDKAEKDLYVEVLGRINDIETVLKDHEKRIRTLERGRKNRPGL